MMEEKATVNFIKDVMACKYCGVSIIIKYLVRRNVSCGNLTTYQKW
jgi:hypothetical protein